MNKTHIFVIGEKTVKVVDKFHYLGDKNAAGGKVEEALAAGVRQEWKKFRDFRHT